MNIPDLIADLRSRINPAYADVLGTESYERRLCVEAMEAQQAEIERLRALAKDAYAAWDMDRDARVGKLLRAMLNPEFSSAYRPDLQAKTFKHVLDDNYSGII